MIGELTFQWAGTPRPAYCLDLAGNLIRCAAAGPEKGLVAFGVELVSSASELACPYPWTLDTEALLLRLALVAESQSSVSAAYPGLQLQKAPYPFVPHLAVTEDEQLIMKAIELFPTLSGANSVAVREQLEANGVFMIPEVDIFSPGIHETAGDGLTVPPVKTMAVGWMSSMKVYRKSLVRSA
ncbi:hypothetical protein H8F21_14505 [Pseudomonas sp. P66]|uniref:Uncharacterized protein n=1 Tax=Pseudomonas arcuscaelestis TaxID=2710591 RepID=A0ABS2BYR6_9PSED|nr:hypothetical protein [Pseudomonas arcuscaelestis]MBM5458776.1 hypothetical protein [Pseudomonas arcuscaelestis]